MAITPHGPLTATAEQVVKVIPKENSLGFLGQVGIGLQMLCKGHSRAGEGTALGMAKEQESSAPKDGGQPWALAQGKALGQRHSPAHGDIPCSPPTCAFPAKRPVHSGKIYLFPEKCRHNLKPQLIKDCCSLLANRK